MVASPELLGLAGGGAVTPAELAGDPADAPAVDVAPDDPMILLYTSGTTSRPRGCVHTHAAYAALGENLVERLRLTPDDRFWTPLPLHHCGGIDLLMGSLAAGCTLVHVGAFAPDVAWRQLVDERATVAFPAFDTIWLPVLDHPEFRAVGGAGPAHGDQRRARRADGRDAGEAADRGADLRAWAGRSRPGSAAWARWTTRPRRGRARAGCR